MAPQRQVWLLLSAILWLGNIEFDSAGDDSVTVRRDEALANAAELLNLDEDELATALSQRVLTAGQSLPHQRASEKLTVHLSWQSGLYTIFPCLPTGCLTAREQCQMLTTLKLELRGQDCCHAS